MTSENYLIEGTLPTFIFYPTSFVAMDHLVMAFDDDDDDYVDGNNDEGNSDLMPTLVTCRSLLGAV